MDAMLVFLYSGVSLDRVFLFNAFLPCVQNEDCPAWICKDGLACSYTPKRCITTPCWQHSCLPIPVTGESCVSQRYCGDNSQCLW
jgi:hypothetical protein